ncbi:MAG: aminopeptidase [Vicinamibacterales bacterium]
MRYALCCALTVLLPGAARPAAAQAQFSFDWPAIAARLVQQLAPQPGERLLILAHPGLFEDLIPHLRYAIARAGATDVGVVDVLAEPVLRGWDLDLVRRGNARARAAYKAMFAGVDGAIMMPGAVPAHPAYAALQDLLREGRGRTVHFHWVENGSAYPLPGQPLPSRAAIDALYQRALLQTDYAALGRVLERFEQALRTGEVRVTSPAGTDLRFRVGTRVVNRQDGDASAARTAKGQVLIDREIELPAGVARVAPLEDSVEGTIAFPPSQWDGRPVEGLRLHLARGVVTRVEATSGREAVEREMQAAGAAGRSFREFALGFNPLLAVPERTPWIPYYGYGAGVVRLSLGDNSELGGNVTGGYVRWNFFTDLTVTVNGQVWVKAGRLAVP